MLGTERDSVRLAMAHELGLRTVVIDGLEAAAPPLGFDTVVDCSGSAVGVGSAMENVRKGGHYVQIGLCGRPVMVDLDAVCLKELTVISFTLTRQAAVVKLVLDPRISA